MTAGDSPRVETQGSHGYRRPTKRIDELDDEWAFEAGPDGVSTAGSPVAWGLEPLVPPSSGGSPCQPSEIGRDSHGKGCTHDPYQATIRVRLFTGAVRERLCPGRPLSALGFVAKNQRAQSRP